MIIQKVNVKVGIRDHNGDEHYGTETYRTGHQALPVTEVAILQAVHGLRSVGLVSAAGEFETSKQEEYDRLCRKYKMSLVALAYPSAAAPFPKTVEDLDLDPDQFDDRPARALPPQQPQTSPAQAAMGAVER